MKNPLRLFSLLTLLMVLGYNIQTYAQTPQYSTSTGTGGNWIPFGAQSWADQRCQFLYTPGEFGSTVPSGQITTIYFRAQQGATATYTNFQVDIGQNSTTSLSTTWQTGLTTALTSSSYTISVTSGNWFAITLDNPIPFDPSLSLIIDTRQSATTPSPAIALYNMTATGNRRAYGSSTATSASGSGTQRYDFGFDLITCNQPTGLAAGSITSNSAALTWNAVSGSAGYEYVLDNVATAPTGSGTLITATTYNAFSLNSNTTYYFHVRNKCNATNFSLWETIPFTTLVNPCGYPNGITYHAPTATTADFHWLHETGSLGYEYTVDQSGANPSSGTPTSDTFANLSMLTGGQTYYFHLRNKCSSTNTWSDWNTVQFLMPECKAPINILFSTVSDTSVDLLWSLMPASNRYEYQVDLSRQDPPPGSGFSTTTGITAHVDALIPNTKYYAHIRSVCFINDYSPWAVDSFVTQYACGAPMLTLNNPGSSTPVVSWMPVTDAMEYEYKINSSTSTPAFGNATTNGTSVSTTLPNDGKNYYIHVRTKCNSQFEFSAWSTLALRESPTGITTVQDDVFAVNVYPNPARDKVTIKTTGTTANDGIIQITGMDGKVLITQKVEADNTQADISSLPKGIYLLKYQDKLNIKLMKIEKL